MNYSTIGMARRKYQMTLKPSKLDGAVCYLSGSMEYCPEGGVAWRRNFIKRCQEHGLGFTFLDPTNKPAGLNEEKNGEYTNLRNARDWEGLTKYVKKIRRDDLRCVDLSDFVVVCIDKKIHACGTYDEVFTAEDQQKPVLCISVGGKESLPGWLFAVLRLEEIFDSVEECADYLGKLNNGTLPLDDRWVLIRRYLKQEV
jgi:hypothetical protein